MRSGEVNYWLCVTNEENWKVVRRKNLWGVPERHRNAISKVKKGDKLLFYIKQGKGKDAIKEPVVAGIFEADSEFFRDNSKIFKVPKGMRDEIFPFRIRLKPIKIFEKPLKFKPLIPELKFITNKQRWSGHLMGKAMINIPEDDFKLVLKRFQRRNESVEI